MFFTKRYRLIRLFTLTESIANITGGLKYNFSLNQSDVKDHDIINSLYILEVVGQPLLNNFLPFFYFIFL